MSGAVECEIHEPNTPEDRSIARLAINDIAKQIRKDIARAKLNGSLPKNMTVSIRVQKHVGCQRINAYVSDDFCWYESMIEKILRRYRVIRHYPGYDSHQTCNYYGDVISKEKEIARKRNSSGTRKKYKQLKETKRKKDQWVSLEQPSKKKARYSTPYTPLPQ